MIFLWIILTYVLVVGVLFGIAVVFANLDKLLAPAGCIAVVIGGVWLTIKALVWISTLVPARIDEIGSQAFMLVILCLMALVWAYGAFCLVRWLAGAAVRSFQRYFGTARHS